LSHDTAHQSYCNQLDPAQSFECTESLYPIIQETTRRQEELEEARIRRQEELEEACIRREEAQSSDDETIAWSPELFPEVLAQSPTIDPFDREAEQEKARNRHTEDRLKRLISGEPMQPQKPEVIEISDDEEVVPSSQPEELYLTEDDEKHEQRERREEVERHEEAKAKMYMLLRMDAIGNINPVINNTLPTPVNRLKRPRSTKK
jgi:hypothetical protein